MTTFLWLGKLGLRLRKSADHPVSSSAGLPAATALRSSATQKSKSGAAAGDITARLQALKELHDTGLIDTSVYQDRSEEHTSELQSLMRISYAVFFLKKKITNMNNKIYHLL